MKKQLVIISDMEGASGIFEENIEEIINGSDKWKSQGRDKMTSDILAVCDAAIEYGIDDIMYYDAHYAGNPESNTVLEKLPKIVRVFDTPNRCFYWRRIRGQADFNPYGVITVGQHARNGEPDAYFEHTIQSPPIKSYWVNDIHIAEIGSAILNFNGSKYIANIGCAASEKEAKEISEKVHHISVKDKKRKWEPSSEETYDLIKKGVTDALNNYDNLEAVDIEGPFKFRMELCQYYHFDVSSEFSWKGHFEDQIAYWEAPSFEIGSEIFDFVRERIMISDRDLEKLREERRNGTYCSF